MAHSNERDNRSESTMYYAPLLQTSVYPKSKKKQKAGDRVIGSTSVPKLFVCRYWLPHLDTSKNRAGVIVTKIGRYSTKDIKVVKAISIHPVSTQALKYCIKRGSVCLAIFIRSMNVIPRLCDVACISVYPNRLILQFIFVVFLLFLRWELRCIRN